MRTFSFWRFLFFRVKGSTAFHEWGRNEQSLDARTVEIRKRYESPSLKGLREFHTDPKRTERGGNGRAVVTFIDSHLPNDKLTTR